MSRIGFELTIPVSEVTKAFGALDRKAPVIYTLSFMLYIRLHQRLTFTN
jgi:hypothetical protein